MRSFAIIIVALASALTLGAFVAHAADEPDELMPGRIVIIKTGKLAKFVAKPPTGMTFDLPDATNDPAAEGGLLEMFDDSPFTPAAVDFVLHASGWKGLGSPAGSKGYKYKGAGTPGHPCRVVLVKEKVVKAVCKGSDVALPTPFQGQVGIVLSIGIDTKRYCAVFGGGESKNDETALKRMNAIAPGVCPLDLNSSTTIPPTTSTSSTSSTTTTDTVVPPSSTSTSTSTTTTASGTITTTSTSLPPSATTTSTMGGPGFTTTSTFGTTVTSTSSTTTSTILVPCGEAEAPACMGGECPVPGTHCVYNAESETCGCIFTTTTTT